MSTAMSERDAPNSRVASPLESNGSSKSSVFKFHLGRCSFPRVRERVPERVTESACPSDRVSRISCITTFQVSQAISDQESGWAVIG